MRNGCIHETQITLHRSVFNQCAGHGPFSSWYSKLGDEIFAQLPQLDQEKNLVGDIAFVTNGDI